MAVRISAEGNTTFSVPHRPLWRLETDMYFSKNAAHSLQILENGTPQEKEVSLKKMPAQKSEHSQGNIGSSDMRHTAALQA